MSRSPRKLVLRAVDALREMDAVLARYPDADASVRAALGEEGLAEVRQARDALARAAERLGGLAADASAADPGAGPDGEGGRHQVPPAP